MRRPPKPPVGPKSSGASNPMAKTTKLPKPKPVTTKTPKPKKRQKRVTKVMY
jgi:hypothetical protein